MAFFLTGVTGSLGAFLLRELFEGTAADIVVLIRARNRDHAEERLRQTLEHFPSCRYEDMRGRIRIIVGSVEDHGGLRASLAEFRGSIEQVFHCAAATNFQSDISTCRAHNFMGTRHVVEAAEDCPRLKRIHYIGTTFILGRAAKTLHERDLVFRREFNNYYEQSKYETELFVRERREAGSPIVTYRVGVLMGDCENGTILNFKLFYEAIRLFSKQILGCFPASHSTRHNFVPVDVAARWIFALSRLEDADGPAVFHIVSPNDFRCEELVTRAADFFGYKNPRWVRLTDRAYREMTRTQKLLIAPFIPYFNYRGRVGGEATFDVLRGHGVPVERLPIAYFDRLFQYCLMKGYVKK